MSFKMPCTEAHCGFIRTDFLAVTYPAMIGSFIITDISPDALQCRGGAVFSSDLRVHGGVFSTTPATADDQMMRRGDVYRAATEIDGNWTWESSTEPSSVDPTQVKFARTANLVTVYQEYANTGIRSVTSVSSDPAFTFDQNVPLEFRPSGGGIRQGVIAGTYNYAPASYVIEVSDSVLSLKYVGQINVTDGKKVSPGAFSFTFCV